MPLSLGSVSSNSRNFLHDVRKERLALFGYGKMPEDKADVVFYPMIELKRWRFHMVKVKVKLQ